MVSGRLLRLWLWLMLVLVLGAEGEYAICDVTENLTSEFHACHEKDSETQNSGMGFRTRPSNMRFGEDG